MKDSEDTNWENMVWCHRCGMVFLFSQIRYNCTNRPLWDQSGPSNIENLMRFNLLQWYLYATNAPNSGIAIISRTRNNSGEIIYTRTIVHCQNSLKNLVQVHVALRSRHADLSDCSSIDSQCDVKSTTSQSLPSRCRASLRWSVNHKCFTYAK